MSEPRSGVQSVQTRIVLRPYASALPMAAFAFGVGNLLYSGLLLGWIPPSESMVVAIILLAFAAPLELFPSVLAFLSRDSGGATAFGIFGASWIVQGLQLLVAGSDKPSAAGGIFLFSLVGILLILAVITFRGKPLLGVLIIFAILRTAAAALMNFGMQALKVPAAILGLVVTAMAFYGALAFLHEDVQQVLSALTLRSGDAKAAMQDPLEDQLEQVTREAGVRKQL